MQPFHLGTKRVQQVDASAGIGEHQHERKRRYHPEEPSELIRDRAARALEMSKGHTRNIAKGRPAWREATVMSTDQPSGMLSRMGTTRASAKWLAVGLAGAALALDCAGCRSSSPSQPAPITPSPTATPAAAAFTGRVKHVTSDAASADVTLNGVRYVHISGQSAEVTVVDVTLAGTSAKPFAYTDAAFVFAYADDN